MTAISLSFSSQVRGMHACVSVERRSRNTSFRHARGRVSHVLVDENMVVEADLEKGETDCSLGIPLQFPSHSIIKSAQARFLKGRLVLIQD